MSLAEFINNRHDLKEHMRAEFFELYFKCNNQDDICRKLNITVEKWREYDKYFQHGDGKEIKNLYYSYWYRFGTVKKIV